jgi:hypothetical protein
LELDKIFGLPAHPLLVHAAVVLVPLAALAWIGTGWRDAWRRAYYLPITLLALGGAGAAFLAKQSGEPLAESVRHAGKRVGEHPEQGDTAFVFAVLFAAACVAVFAWQRFGATLRERLGLSSLRLPFDDDVILYAASLPLAVLAIWFMIAAGHSGATLVWKTNR